VSNPNKHKPLSKEELFKLLENTNKASGFDELDDFEKEAFEGFSAHTDAKKAEALTEEVNLAISKKVYGTDVKGEKKNKVIWIGAAASIVLIIMISVFFFNQSKKQAQTTIVLNEHTEEIAPVISPAGTIPPLEPGSETSVGTTAPENNRGEELAKLMQAEGPKQPEVIASISDEPNARFTENKPVLSEQQDQVRKEKRDDDDVLKKQNEVVADKLEVKGKSAANDLEQEIANADVSLSSQNVATNISAQSIAIASTATKGGKDADYKVAEEKSAKAKKAPEKQSAAKEQSNPDSESSGATAYTQPASSPVQNATLNNSNTTILAGAINNNSAYYAGGELAIKQVVVAYFKDKALTVPIGKYNMKGTVDVKGKLKVNALTKLSVEDCNCSGDIQKALNAMKNWNAAIKNGKKVSSNVEFVLTF
jgi:hypothetical protein